MKTHRSLLILLGALLVLGCDKKSESSGGSSSESKKDDKKDKKSKGDDDDDDKPTKKPKGDDKGEKGDKPEKGDGSLDLSSIDAWKGWSIKAPKGAKASEDGSDLNVAGKTCDKCPYFDLMLSQKKPDLKATKKVQTDDAAAAKDKITFTEDTSDTLEWTREAGTKKTRNFVRIVTVGSDEIGCWPSSSVVAEADFTAMKDACKTVAKK
jgi:hypothetical protein